MADSPTFPNSLAYVREQRKVTLGDAAAAIGTSAEQLARFEQGERVPSARQYALLETIYGVPDYLLAGSGRPNIEPLLVDLRTEVGAPAAMSPSGLKAYFAARNFSNSIGELARFMGLSVSTRPLRGSGPNELISRAAEFAKLWQFDPTAEQWIRSPDNAFRYLRYQIEQHGIFCLVTSAKTSDFRGIYSPDDSPTIIINKNTFRTKARIFTLMHEFAHAILGVGGVSDPFITPTRIEQLCNAFATEFIAPTKFFRALATAELNSNKLLSSVVRAISTRSLLSLGAVAYRLRLEGLISAADYEAWRAAQGLPPEFGGEDGQEDEPPAGGGGNYAFNVLADKGYAPIVIVKEALERGVIDEVDAGRLLNARGDTLQTVFDVATTRTRSFDR